MSLLADAAELNRPGNHLSALLLRPNKINKLKQNLSLIPIQPFYA